MIARTIIFIGMLCSPALATIKTLAVKKKMMVMTKGRNPVFDCGLCDIEFDYTVDISLQNRKVHSLELDYAHLKESDPKKYKDINNIIKFELRKLENKVAVRDCEPTDVPELQPWRLINDLHIHADGRQDFLRITYTSLMPVPVAKHFRFRFYVMNFDDLIERYPIIDKSKVEFNAVPQTDDSEGTQIAFADFRNLDKEELHTIPENKDENKEKIKGTVDILKELIPEQFNGCKIYIKSYPTMVGTTDGPMWWEATNVKAEITSGNEAFKISFDKTKISLPSMNYRVKVMQVGKDPNNHASLLEFNCTSSSFSGQSEYKMDANMNALELLVNHRALGELHNLHDDPTAEELAQTIQDLLAGEFKAFLVARHITKAIERGTEQNFPVFTYSKGISVTTPTEGCLCIEFLEPIPYVQEMPKYHIKFLRNSDAEPETAISLFECNAHESTLYSRIQMTISDAFCAVTLAYCLQDWFEGKAFIAAKEDNANATWKMLMPPLDTINSLGSGVAPRDIINPGDGIFHSREKCDWGKKIDLPVLFIDTATIEKLKLLPNNCSKAFRAQLCEQYFQCKDVTAEEANQDLMKDLKLEMVYHLVDADYNNNGGTVLGNMIIVKTDQSKKPTTIGGILQTVPQLPKAIQQLAWELIIFGKEIYESNKRETTGQPKPTKTYTYDSAKGTLKVKRRVSGDNSEKKTLFIDVNNTLGNCRSSEVEVKHWSKGFASDSQKAGLYMQKFLALRVNLYKNLRLLCEPYGEYQCVPFSTSPEIFINVLVNVFQEKGHFFKEPMTQYDAPDGKKDISHRSDNSVAILLENEPDKGEDGNVLIGVMAFGTNTKIQAAAKKKDSTMQTTPFDTLSGIFTKLVRKKAFDIRDNRMVY